MAVPPESGSNVIYISIVYILSIDTTLIQFDTTSNNENILKKVTLVFLFGHIFLAFSIDPGSPGLKDVQRFLLYKYIRIYIYIYIYI